MVKIRSFLVALVLFIAFTVAVHAVCAGIDMTAKNDDFGMWFSPYKDKSESMLNANTTKDTMLVMGSSEFRHGRNSKYHPMNTFKGRDMNIVTIGGPYNQTLFHLIALGSVEPNIKGGNVVLLVSPTWFKSEGVTGDNYSLRFSDTQYAAFMENEEIPADVKKYVADRSEQLLANDSKNIKKVKRINAYNLDDKRGLISGSIYRAERFYSSDQDRITSAIAMRAAGLDKEKKPPKKVSGPPDFKALKKEADKDSAKYSKNRYTMSDKIWNRKLKNLESGYKNSHSKDTYQGSPEFSDLENFLKLCKAADINCKLIVMPVNGKWFDYTGMTKEKRAVVDQRVSGLAEKYGAEAAILSGYDYTPYITKDAVHPWNKGWVIINEEIYNFYDEQVNG